MIQAKHPFKSFAYQWHVVPLKICTWFFFFFSRLKCLKSISTFTFESAEEVNLWKQQSQFDQHKGQRIDKLEMLLKQAINIVNVSLTMSYNFSSQQEVSQLCQHKCQVPGPGDNCVQKNYSDSMQPFKSLCKWIPYKC